MTLLPPALQAGLRPVLNKLSALETRQGAPSNRATKKRSEQGGRQPSNLHRIRPADLYLAMDLAATDLNDSRGWQAARHFPRRQREAKQLASLHGCAEPGRLPWALLEARQNLADALRAANIEAAERQLQRISLLATAAAQPFSITRDPAGQERGFVQVGAADKRSGGPHDHVFSRYQQELLQRLRARLSYELRIWPQRVMDFEPPREAVFETMLRSYQALDMIAAEEVAACQRLGITSAQSFYDHRAAYYRELSLRVGWIMEARLEDGALLTARLIIDAWREAGSPSEEMWEAWLQQEVAEEKQASLDQERGESNGQPGELAAHDAEQVVASTNSKVYHRASCPHVRRIKESNLRKFSSAKEAEAKGLRPCHACHPQPDGRKKADQK